MQQDWFDNPQWWFASDDEIDNIICNKFGSLLNHDMARQGYDSIDQILIYDQLPRHLFRHQQANHIIAYFLRKALECADMDDALLSHSPEKICFALMPYRHTEDFDIITRKVLPVVWQALELHPNNAVLKRFIKATYMRMPLVPCSSIVDEGIDKSILAFAPDEPPIVPKVKQSLLRMNCCKVHAIDHVVVSLSGGVDSMVALWLLLYDDSIRANVSSIVAVHIDYANRETSQKESDFVVDWCRRLGVPVYVRRIAEIQREPCMKHGLREMYESYTRNVRYHCYKHFPDAHIVLGHNKDDVLENIFTNIAHRNKYENLDGMTCFGEQQEDGIRFWRPLLDVSKDDIIAFARAHNIPYLPNSTPPWSQRGQIRNTIVPVLNNWNPQFVESLYSLSRDIQVMYAAMNTMIPDTLQFAKPAGNLDTSEMFWKMVFQRTKIKASSKSISTIIEKVEIGKNEWKAVVNKTTNLSYANCEYKLSCAFNAMQFVQES